MANEFHDDRAFSSYMQPKADKIYRATFPGCEIHRLEYGDCSKVYDLDKHCGVDLIVKLSSGCQIYIQEKYRRYSDNPFYDFTQEYKEKAGHEDGEWFKLISHMNFYGWANRGNFGFEKWILLNTTTYKLTVESRGGLWQIGTLYQNKKHGRASFYGIPLPYLNDAVVSQFDIETFKEMPDSERFDFIYENSEWLPDSFPFGLPNTNQPSSNQANVGAK